MQPPQPAIEPNRAGFLDLRNHRQLLDWTWAMADPHKMIRFVGLKTFRGRADAYISELYIEPAFVASHVTIDQEPATWPPETPLLEMLAQHQRLIILGDPGSGKTTLINWITCQLARSHTKEWLRAIGALVPIPIVVRNHGDITDWDQLLAAWLGQPQNKLLDAELLEDLLQRGQALVMVDGIDELASEAKRKKLRTIIWYAMDRYPKCRWLLSSRLVGYEEVPFHEDSPERDIKQLPLPNFTAPKLFALAHLAPMSDNRIYNFAYNWFLINEGQDENKRAKVKKLVKSLNQNEGTRKLMRGPLLLTLMAQIYKTSGRLPNGRIQLYDDLTEGYLKTIDQERKLEDLPYSLQEKYRLLGYVAFQMQMRREGTKAVLVAEDEIIKWLNEELINLGRAEDGARLVEHFSKRSGLLLPRGEEQYAWMHLSFGEYFTARHLEEQITAPAWLLGGMKKRANVYGIKALGKYAQQRHWHETLILLFERMGGKTGWPEMLTEALWQKNFSAAGEKDLPLMAEVLIDGYTGLKAERRKLGLRQCWLHDLKLLQKSKTTRVAELLFRQGEEHLESLIEAWQAGSFKHLHLINATGLRSLERLGALTSMESLFLQGCSGLTSLAGIDKLSQLWAIVLNETPVNDLEPLTKLKNLETLCVLNEQTLDLSPLKKIPTLKTLMLPKRTKLPEFIQARGIKIIYR